MTRTAWSTVPTFLFLWLMVGFALGTFILVGPVRWLTGWTRSAGLGAGVENVLMVVVILAYVALSAFVARWLTARVVRSNRPLVRWGLPVLMLALAGGALWGWMQPGFYARMAGGGAEERLAHAGGAEFVFGAYPDEARLRELRDQGFTAVVSLQHPAVVPMEPRGIAAERESAREVGIRFIHAPMLPWVSGNRKALELIRGLADEGEGKYFVHCGLGRDRVNVVRRMLERDGVRLATETGERATSFADREAPMERGMPVQLEEGVWLIPYPNEHEIFGNMLAGQYESVVSLLDPAVPEEAAWQDSLSATLRGYGVRLRHAQVRPGAPDEARVLAATVRRLPRPIVVVAPRTPPQPDSAVAAAFQRAYRSVTADEERVAAGGAARGER